MAALIPTASVTGSGTMTLAGPSTNSNQTINIPDLSGTFSLTTKTVTVYTSGSGTYTTPTGCKSIFVRMVGGGGGGGASSTNTGATGGTTTFGASLSATGGDLIVTGSTGGAGAKDTGNPTGGMGGNSVFGGASTGGLQNTAGSNALGYGSGGGGAGGNLATLNSAGGGGAGGYLEETINSPSATYSYAVGAGGAGGVGGGTGVNAGGNGYSGVIVIQEFY